MELDGFQHSLSDCVYYWMHIQIAISVTVWPTSPLSRGGGVSVTVLVCVHGCDTLFASAMVFLIR